MGGGRMSRLKPTRGCTLIYYHTHEGGKKTEKKERKKSACMRKNKKNRRTTCLVHQRVQGSHARLVVAVGSQEVDPARQEQDTGAGDAAWLVGGWVGLLVWWWCVGGLF